MHKIATNFLTFIDYHSRYSWTYFLRNKLETVDCFNHNVRLMKTQNGRIPKILRSDQGGEYRSKGPQQNCVPVPQQTVTPAKYKDQERGGSQIRCKITVFKDANEFEVALREFHHRSIAWICWPKVRRSNRMEILDHTVEQLAARSVNSRWKPSNKNSSYWERTAPMKKSIYQPQWNP